MLYEILKTSKLGASFAPDMYTALWAQKLARDGEVKTLSGIPPLTFRSNGQPLLDYLISGNTVQSGTPTPDSPVMPQGTGERTGNLFDDFDIAGQVPSVTNGKLVNSISGGTTSFIPLSNPLVSLTLFSSTMQTYLFLYDENKTFIGQGTLTSVGTVSSSVITGYANAKYARLRSDKISLYDKNVTLVYGSTAPSSYIPPGYKIRISSANTTTPVYLGEVETTRRIKKLVLTGEETFSYANSCFTYTFDGKPTSVQPIKTLIFSNAYESVEPKYRDQLRNYQCCITRNYNQIAIRDDNYTDATDFKVYLQQQYANGTPVCIWYVLATEETGIVNEPLMKIGEYADTLSMEQAGVQIPTAKGSTTLDVETAVKPSEVYIKYKE